MVCVGEDLIKTWQGFEWSWKRKECGT